MSMNPPELHLVVPGPLGQEGPGHRFARGAADGLRARGWTVRVHELPGRYPHVDASAILAADVALSRLPDRAAVLIDGLAIPGLAAAMSLDTHRLRMAVRVQRPLWRDPALGAVQATALRSLEQGALACARRLLVPDAGTAAELAALGLPEDRVSVVPDLPEPPPDGTGGEGVDRLAALLSALKG